MPRRWTAEEYRKKRAELIDLYHRQKKNIGAISRILRIAESTVFDRMQRLNISSDPARKLLVGVRKKITYPTLSPDLAEFFGIMLGDGHIAPSTGQIFVYLDANANIEYNPVRSTIP